MFNFKINRMNKKFLSTLLMGALFIASVSVFTSCKDYDEDIQNLQQQVDGLKSDLNSQIATLDAAQKKCASDCATAQAALDQAIKNLESTKANKADVDKAIEDAIKGAKADNDALKTELQKYAADYADAAAAKAAAAAKEEAIKEAVAQAKALVDALDAKKVDLVEFTAKVQELQNSIKAVDDALAAYKTEQTAAWAANDEALKEINLQIDALKKFNEQVQKDFEGVNTNIENLQKDLKKVKEDLEAQKKDLEGQLKAAKDELQKQIDELAKSETIVGLTNRIVALEEKAENNRVEITKIQGWMNEADGKFNEALAGAAKANVLDLYISKVLTSIYLKPEFFYSGIEAIELPALYDYAWAVTKPLTLDETWTQATDKAAIDVCKGGRAYYHLNPWNADIEGATVAFISNEAKTRAGANYGVNDLIKPVKETLDKDSWDKTFAGVLPVDFTGSFETINSLLKAGILPQVALNYKQTVDEKEVNVSSDWALIAPTQYSNLVIADVTWTNHEDVLGSIDKEGNIVEAPVCGHLTRDLRKLALQETAYTHAVKYDETLNLSELVRTHYSYSYRNAAGVEVKSEDLLMDDATFEKFGLEYRFDTISYVLGDNVTSESTHIILEKNEKGETIARPVKVNSDGSQDPANADKASVDRMPIIRVTIVNKETNQVAAYAYMKLRIVEEQPQDPEPEEYVVPFEENKPYYVDCDAADYVYKQTWAQVERLILSDALKGNYSKKTFEANWELVGTGGMIVDVQTGAEATQFGADKKELTEKVGKVTLLKDAGTEETSVLQWTITYDDIMAMFKNEDGSLKNVDSTTGLNTNDIEVYVKFEGKKYNQNVWVKFFLPKGTFHFATGKIDDNKIASYWYDLNSKKPGKKEIRANVTVPGTQDDDCEFKFDMLSTFVGNTVAPAKIAENFPNFMKEAKTQFLFTTPEIAKGNAKFFSADKDGHWTVFGNSMVGDKHKEYTLEVRDGGLTIGVVGGEDVVKLINADNGDMNNIIEYQKTEAAFDILNYVGHDELDERMTFTAYLQVAVKSCYDLFLLDNTQYFNVRFLRPVNLLPGNEYVMEDALDNGSKINVMDLVKLTDWRDYKFEQHPDYIEYYEVEAITPDLEAVRTDLDLDEDKRVVSDKPETLKKLSEVTSNLLLGVDPEDDTTITWNAKTKKFEGQFITYANNSGNVQNFHLYIPLTITYKWGTKTQPIYSVITVKKTVQNAKKF